MPQAAWLQSCHSKLASNLLHVQAIASHCMCCCTVVSAVHKGRTLLWRDKTCPAHAWLIMSWKALLFSSLSSSLPWQLILLLLQSSWFYFILFFIIIFIVIFDNIIFTSVIIVVNDTGIIFCMISVSGVGIITNVSIITIIIIISIIISSGVIIITSSVTVFLFLLLLLLLLWLPKGWAWCGRHGHGRAWRCWQWTSSTRYHLLALVLYFYIQCLRLLSKQLFTFLCTS